MFRAPLPLLTTQYPEPAFLDEDAEPSEKVFSQRHKQVQKPCFNRDMPNVAQHLNRRFGANAAHEAGCAKIFFQILCKLTLETVDPGVL